MTALDTLDDHQVDQLLEGRVPEGLDDLAPLVAILAMVRIAFGGALDEPAEEKVRAVGSEVRLIRQTTDNGDPAAMPVSKADRPRSREVSGLPKWRRCSVSALLTTLFSTLAGKVAAAAVVLTAATTGAVALVPDEPDATVVNTVAEIEEGAETGEDQESEPGTGEAAEAHLAPDDEGDATEEGGPASEASPSADASATDGVPDHAAHGKAVSEAANDHTRDEECGNHGQAVSGVARGVECSVPGARSQRPQSASSGQGAGIPEHAGKPDQPGRPAHAGRPEHAGDVESGEQPGHQDGRGQRPEQGTGTGQADNGAGQVPAPAVAGGAPEAPPAEVGPPANANGSGNGNGGDTIVGSAGR